MRYANDQTHQIVPQRPTPQAGFPNDEVAIKTDVELCREWFDQQIGGTDEEFQTAMQQAEREILIDLRSPKTRREIWDEARRFVAVIFPKL